MPRTRSSERCALSGVILYALRTRSRARGAITGTMLASTRGTPRDHKERNSFACGNNCAYAQRRVCGPSSVLKRSSSASISLRSAVSRGYMKATAASGIRMRRNVRRIDETSASLHQHRHGAAPGAHCQKPIQQWGVRFFAIRQADSIERPASLLAEVTERYGDEDGGSGRHW